jgi:hypothetical protein
METNLIWFRTVKLRQNGDSGMEVTMPPAATRQAGIELGEELDVFVNPETKDIVLRKHEAA